jgi:hypothetical protein
MYQNRLLMLRLKRIEIPSLPGSTGIQRGDILGRTPHRTLLHPLHYATKQMKVLMKVKSELSKTFKSEIKIG